MIRTHPVLLAVLLTGLISCRRPPATTLSLATPRPAGTTGSPAQSLAGHIRLRVLPDIAKDNAAFPRIVPNNAVSAETAASLNQQFDRIDADTRKTRKECRAAQTALDPKYGPGDFETTILVLMRGPRFLSFSMSGGNDCGGPHPNSYTLGLVFDTVTAAPVNWLPLLPGSRLAFPEDKKVEVSPAIFWPPFLQAARAHPTSEDEDEDCKKLYEDGTQPFTVWLDGEKGAIIGYPSVLSHFEDAMCGKEFAIDLPSAKQLGVSPDLIKALEAAHAAALAASKP